MTGGLEDDALGMGGRTLRTTGAGALTVPDTNDPTAAMASFIVSDAVVDAVRAKTWEVLVSPCRSGLSIV